jgi:mannose-6-phosphate isomerase class I
MPVRKEHQADCRYDIYPSFKTGNGRIFSGFDSLALEIKDHRIVTIDGYNGVDFDLLIRLLDSHLHKYGYSTAWVRTADLFKPFADIREMTAPFLGGNDPLFGKRTTLTLSDFFINGISESVKPDPDADISIIAGPGAYLAHWNGLLVYADIPKNEIQYRSRAGSVTNLGNPVPSDPGEMYKCFYFVDWIVLNRHKRDIMPLIDIFIDSQHPETPVWIHGSTLRETLSLMARNPFRARPWFEPGAWGGTWIKNNIEGINTNVPNYAWSFELITPENGLIIESSSLLCEVSFDCLMYQEAEAVLGDCFQRFGDRFPIRFDFLDTFAGGNLSLQCHPRPAYMKEHFGEDFTQEETYYILDTRENAGVYLGFRDDIDPLKFRDDLEDSARTGMLIDPEKHIQKLPVKKHDLLLIPYGTIHGSGKNNLVLEISSTPYIFTFKMYDWVRPDLNGKPRPLNIERGMENLFFDRKGSYVNEKLISRPELISSGTDWQLFHLPTHKSHLYDVRRYHFSSEIDIKTGNKCLVMNLVEGKCIEAESASGCVQKFSHAETFVIPAAAGNVKIRNLLGTKAILVLAYVK